MVVYKHWPKSPPLLPRADCCSPRMRGWLPFYKWRKPRLVGKRLSLMTLASRWLLWSQSISAESGRTGLHTGHSGTSLNSGSCCEGLFSHSVLHFPPLRLCWCFLSWHNLPKVFLGLLMSQFTSNCPFSGLLIKIQGWAPASQISVHNRNSGSAPCSPSVNIYTTGLNLTMPWFWNIFWEPNPIFWNGRETNATGGRPKLSITPLGISKLTKYTKKAKGGYV